MNTQGRIRIQRVWLSFNGPCLVSNLRVNKIDRPGNLDLNPPRSRRVAKDTLT
jgi:hypothetical protein